MKIVEVIGRYGRVDHVGPFADYPACMAWIENQGLSESAYSILDIVHPDAVTL